MLSGFCWVFFKKRQHSAKKKSKLSKDLKNIFGRLLEFLNLSPYFFLLKVDPSFLLSIILARPKGRL